MSKQLVAETDKEILDGRRIMRDPVWMGVIFEIVDNTDEGGSFKVIESNYPDASHPGWSTLDRAERYCQLYWEEHY